MKKEEEKQRLMDQAKLEQEELFFQKWLKQRENLGVAQSSRSDADDHRNTIAMAKKKLLSNKNLTKKEIDELNNQIKISEQKMKMKVSSKQVRK